jgi:hypothetical protein
MNASALLQQYGTSLDIIYPDAPQTVQSLGYQSIYTWDSQPLANVTYTPRPSATFVPHGPYSSQGVFPSNLYLLAIAAVIIAIIIVSIAVLKIKSRRKPSLQ